MQIYPLVLLLLLFLCPNWQCWLLGPLGSGYVTPGTWDNAANGVGWLRVCLVTTVAAATVASISSSLTSHPSQFSGGGGGQDAPHLPQGESYSTH